MASQDESSSPLRKLWLEGVDVEFAHGRPASKLQLSITIGGGTTYCWFEKSDRVSWVGSILCPTTSSCSIIISKKRAHLLQKKIAAFVMPLSAVDGEIISFLDTTGAATVTLKFSGISASRADSDAKLKTMVEEAVTKTESKSLIVERLEKVRGLTKTIEGVGEIVGELHPIIKVVWKATGLLIEACKEREECRKAAHDLTEDLDSFLSLRKDVNALEERPKCREAVGRMLGLIAEISNYICNLASLGIKDALITHGYQKKIHDFKDKFKKARQDFSDSLQVEMIKGVHWLEQNKILEKLNPATNAHYRTGRDHVCLDGTRVELRRKISGWLSHSTELGRLAQARLVCLYGLAGSGKSSVANTIAQAIEGDKGLGLSCFCCRRDDPELSKPERLFPTLAFRIAQLYPTYRAELVSLLLSPEGAGISTGDLEKQFKMLLGDLLPKAVAPACTHVIVVDALDECGSVAEQKQLAELLLSLANDVPWIRIFVTMRPVSDVTELFASSDDTGAVLNINDERETVQDIRLFTETSLRELMLTAEQLDALVERAEGLFIWSSTLAKHVLAGRNPKQEIRQFLSHAHGKTPSNPLEQLYKLYDRVVGSAITRREYAVVIHAILGVVFVSAGYRSLSADSIATFLQHHDRFIDEDRESVLNTTRSLHAVLYEDREGAIRVLHPSFLDYLQGKLENGFTVHGEEMHALMLRGSLATMHRGLKFNICDLEDSYRKNKDVPDLAIRVSESIPEALQYSSLFWFSHLSQSNLAPLSEEVTSQVLRLLGSPKALFWLEVLSLLDAVGHGIVLLRECAAFFAGQPEISSIAADLDRFVMSFAEAMESAPHIYLSALSWPPEKAQLRRSIASSFKHLAMIANKEDNWQGARWVKSVGSVVDSVACSLDGRFFAAGFHDCIVRIFNAHTCEAVGEPLKGHSGWVLSLAFSPDSQSIASGSADGAIRIWNVERGKVVKTFEGHSDLICSVAFSPDGQRLASGCKDKTIRVWDVQTGAAVGNPFEGHTDWVRSVAFSSDGERVISGSDDNTVRIWDLRTGDQIGDPLRGHSHFVHSVACPRDGKIIASASQDNTVCIWDTQTGAPIREPLTGYVSNVRSIRFSADSKQVASASRDGTIRIWSAEIGSPVCAPLTGHSGPVVSVAFSADGRRLLSGGDDGTLRIWDIQSSVTVDDAPQGHSGSVLCVAYSPDGQYIASGSADQTVCIWDARTSAAVREPLRGHSDAIRSIAISGDGLFLASGSRDGSLQIWETNSWTASSDAIEGHAGPVLTIAISPNNQQIASGSEDRTVHLWDKETRSLKVLEGHTDTVNSVAFLPDGQRIVSASRDKTIRLWDTRTGDAIGQPLTGHTHWVRAVAVSPDGRVIASGSDDFTVRLWDANTCEVIHVLKGHSHWVLSVGFSPNGQHLVSGSYRTIEVWNLETRKAVGEPLRGHSDLVTSVAFSPDGERVVSCSHDSTVRVWDPWTHVRLADCDHPLEVHRARWYSNCARMDGSDGWVKDGDDLLLWVPAQYRDAFKNGLKLVIGGTERWRKPEVDLAKLFAYSGHRWTDLYHAHSEV